MRVSTSSVRDAQDHGSLELDVVPEKGSHDWLQLTRQILKRRIASSPGCG